MVVRSSIRELHLQWDTGRKRGKKKDPAGACRLEVIVLKFMFTRLCSAQQVNNAEDAAVTIWEVTMMYEVV